MTTPRTFISSVRSAVAVTLGVVVALSYLASSPASVLAAPESTIPSASVTIPAGGSATIQVKGIAMQEGAALPQGALALAQPALAPDRIRTALYYAIDWGYTETDPQQVALAIWWMQSGAWLSPDHAIAERIANAAAGSPGLPFWNPDGVSLVNLLAQGQAALAPTSFTGDTATLTVQNTSAQSLTVYLPYGALLAGPNGTAIIWAVQPGVVPPQATTPPTEVVPPTSAPEPSATALVKSGATATEPVQNVPTETPTELVKGDPSETPADPPASATSSIIPTATAAAQPGEPVESAPPAEPEATALVKSAPASASDGGSSTQEQAGSTSRNLGAQPSGSGTQSQPAAPVAAPPPPLATQPAKSDDSAPGGALAAPGAPSPVSTAQSQAPPNPELTQLATVEPAKPTPTFTEVVKPIETKAVPPGTDPGGAVGGSDQKPTEPPVKATPVPTPEPAGGSNDGGPTIIVGGDIKPPVPAPGSTGSPPTSSPSTGAGASSLPTWLSLFSALLVLGGWSLRRMGTNGRKPAPVPARTEPEVETETETTQ